MNEKLEPVKKITVGEMIKNVLNAVEMRPCEEGAVIMYHFINGMLVGGNIDLDKGIKTQQPFVIEESSLEKWLKRNSPTSHKTEGKDNG